MRHTGEGHAEEIARGERFAFGENWRRFLDTLDDDRIAAAEESLRSMLAVSDLANRSFLDVGCGSGLFSLAARRLGASVRSFDFDPQSVACALALRERYFPGDASWRIEEGSALDEPYLETLGQYDVVYSWGVLHHTGRMWQAIDNVARRVATGGTLFIALYNDQGWASRAWTALKRAYNRAPAPARPLLVLGVGAYFEARSLAGRVLRREPILASKRWRNRPVRGMSPWHDLVDWVGGYPFEVARPEQVLDFMRARGFNLVRMTTCAGGLGCNQFVLSRQ